MKTKPTQPPRPSSCTGKGRIISATYNYDSIFYQAQKQVVDGDTELHNDNRELHNDCDKLSDDQEEQLRHSNNHQQQEEQDLPSDFERDRLPSPNQHTRNLDVLQTPKSMQRVDQLRRHMQELPPPGKVIEAAMQSVNQFLHRMQEPPSLGRVPEAGTPLNHDRENENSSGSKSPGPHPTLPLDELDGDDSVPQTPTHGNFTPLLGNDGDALNEQQENTESKDSFKAMIRPLTDQA